MALGAFDDPQPIRISTFLLFYLIFNMYYLYDIILLIKRTIHIYKSNNHNKFI
jgi:hypothetical protein